MKKRLVLVLVMAAALAVWAHWQTATWYDATSNEVRCMTLQQAVFGSVK